MRPLVKDCRRPLEGRKDKEDILPQSPWREWFQYHDTDFRLLATRTVREEAPVVLSHQVDGMSYSSFSKQIHFPCPSWNTKPKTKMQKRSEVPFLEHKHMLHPSVPGLRCFSRGSPEDEGWDVGRAGSNLLALWPVSSLWVCHRLFPDIGSEILPMSSWPWSFVLAMTTGGLLRGGLQR